MDLSAHLVEQDVAASYSAVETQTGARPQQGGCFSPRADLEHPDYDSYIPVKSGVDASTQIEENDCLFDFDAEVEPLLDVIVGKTLEWASLEVEEEEELASLQRRRSELLEGKRGEIARVQALQQAEAAKWAEKERVVKREALRVQHERIAQEKIAAVNFYGTAFGDLEAQVLHSLTNCGHFRNRQRDAVEFNFMPWLLEATAGAVARSTFARRLADDLILAALEPRK